MKGLKKLLITTASMSVLTIAALVTASAASVAYGAGTVSATELNVRSEAGTGSQVTGKLQNGDTVVILDKTSDSWFHISTSGSDGYVASRYIADVETAKNFAASGSLTGNNVRMRSKPTTSATVLGTYPSGTGLSIIGINNGWYKVTASGKTGYIRSDFIALTSGGSTASEDTAGGSVTAASSAAGTEGQKIAEYAMQFVGMKYIYGASSPSVGFDCSGLTYYVYNKFGIPISRTASQQYKNNGTTISKSELQPGDLVFFSSNGGKSVTHVGLYIGDGNFVNASTSRTGVIISSLSSSWYTKTWYGAKRIVG